MDSLYTPQVREYVSTRDWPRGLQFDVTEQFNDIEGMVIPQLNFIFYRDNWVQLRPEAQMKAAMVVKEVMEKLRADGIRCYMGKMEARRA